MPQKRNPDAAELVRAKTGRVIGALNALLMVMKGLPLAYQKDMQEDKEGTIDALDALSLSIAAMTGMVRDMEPDAARMKKAAGEGYATATDLADWLVRTLEDAVPRGAPRHRPHRRQGRGRAGVPLHQLPLADMQADRAAHHQGRFEVLSVERFGEEPHQLWRHRAEECARAGQALAQAARQESANELSCIGAKDASASPSAICYGAADSGVPRDRDVQSPSRRWP